MEGIAAIFDVLGSALNALVNLGDSGGTSRGLQGNAGRVITNLPPLPIPPVRAAAPRPQKTASRSEN